MMFGWWKNRNSDVGRGDGDTLVSMRPGQSGVVEEVRCGHRAVERLAALGIRTGKRVTKVSSMVLGGPVTVEVDRAHVAIGRHMADRVLVRVSGG
jgi:ferrous iron transport protein A